MNKKVLIEKLSEIIEDLKKDTPEKHTFNIEPKKVGFLLLSSEGLMLHGAAPNETREPHEAHEPQIGFFTKQEVRALGANFLPIIANIDDAAKFANGPLLQMIDLNELILLADTTDISNWLNDEADLRVAGAAGHLTDLELTDDEAEVK